MTQILVCTECGWSFEFRDSEQRLFAAKGWDDPKRCQSCRRVARERRDAGRALR